MDDLISIVVPVYGVEDYVEQCIDSLLAQTHPRVEIILVNDGSVDRSGEICDRYARLDRRLRVIHKENGGLVSARKAGVAVASGEYLGFVDGDDWVGDDYFSFLHHQASTSEADLVICGHVREFLGKQEVISPRNPAGVYNRADILAMLLPSAIYNGIFFQHGVSTYVWNKLFRRDRAAQFVSDIDERIVMGEDAALTYPYLASCERVAICGAGNYFYRQRSNSIVKSVPDINREYHQLSALFKYLKRRLEEVPYCADLMDQLQRYFYAQVLVRSGAVIEAPGYDYWAAFPGLTPGQRVVVYNSGSFGQHVVGALRRLGKFNLTGWIDEDDHESQRSGLQVSSPDSLAALDFDLILVAAIDSEYSEALADELERKGISREKISILRPDFAELGERLRAIGFDVDSFSFSPRSRNGRHIACAE